MQIRLHNTSTNLRVDLLLRLLFEQRGLLAFPVTALVCVQNLQKSLILVRLAGKPRLSNTKTENV